MDSVLLPCFMLEMGSLQDPAAPTECHAMVIWFDVEFSKRFCSQQPVTLSTSPFATPTHWAQTVLPLRWVECTHLMETLL